MKKILSRIFSAALATALVVPAAVAAPQLAQKAKGGNASALAQNSVAAQKALPQGLLQVKGINALVARTNAKAENSGLAQAKTFFAPNKEKKAPLKVQKAEGQMPTIIGSLVFTKNTERVTGLYQVPTAEGQDFQLLAAGAQASNGGVLIDETYYATNYFEFWGMIFITVEGYNVETGEKVYEASPEDVSAILFGATYDANTNTTYSIGYQSSGSGLQLGKIVYEEDGPVVTPIAEFNYNTSALAIDSNGQLWAILYSGQNDGDGFVVTGSRLVKVNKETGAIDEIGSTGQLPQYITGGAIDTKTNRFFWTVCNAAEEAYLTEVNMTTGLATPIHVFPEGDEITGVQILPPAAEPTAPAAATDLALEFPKGAMTGTVKFTAPTTLYDGTAATGELSYKVIAGEVSVEGTTSFGAATEAEMTFTKPGFQEFIVTTSNAAGASPKARIKAFIGNGIPATPKPKLAYADGTLTLKWDSITKSVDGGYIDVDAMTYTIKDAEGGVVAEGVTATEWTKAQEETEELTGFSYTVTAVCSGISSAPGQSNSVTLGAIIPPYTNTFDTADDCASFTIIDGNEDGRTWTWYDGGMRVQYNMSQPMNDWLISAPIKAEAGQAYYVTFDVKNHLEGRYPEIFEICWGTDNTAEAMTHVIVDSTEITNATYLTFGGYVAPTESGKIYVGIHGISETNQYYLYIDNFSVAAGVSAGAPGAATDLKVSPAAYGSLFTSVEFKAPALSIGGAALTANLEKVEIMRDDEVIAVKNDVKPGASIKVADALDESGNYTYTVVAYNAEGKGEPVSSTVFVGVAAPTPVTNFAVAENGNKYTISWNAPATDINGNAIAANQVKYNVYYVTAEGDLQLVAENSDATSYVYTYEGAEQDFEQFAVEAVTEGGASTVVGTGLIACGPAYPGMFESFPDADLSYILGLNTSGGAKWAIYPDDYFSDVASYDGDGGFIGMNSSTLDYYAMIFTGKISLADMTNPAVTFYTYSISTDDINEIEVSVTEANADNWVPVKSIVINEVGQNGWCKITVPLNDYADQNIQVGITGVIKKYAYIMIDNIKIGSLLADDLAAVGIAAPAKVATGNDYDVTVTVANEGANEATAYTVELYANGELAESKAGEALAASAKAVVTFTQTMSAVATEPVVYMAKVVYAADLDNTNNQTDEVTVAPKVSTLPAATDLKGDATDNGNVLTWNEPDLANLSALVNEDFEDAESWAHEVEDWIFVDVDQSEVGGFQGLDIPGIEPGTTKASWFVFDASGEQFNTTYAAASGDKYLAALFRYDDGTTNDWAISPVLSGAAQTISFKAKSYSGDYPEKLMVYYSTGSTEVADFIAIEGATISVVPNDWTEYNVALPEGAKRFALRSCATGSFMLMLDDVVYESGKTLDLSVVGYDIYRDGVKLNTEVVAETTYTDATAEAGKEYTYNVIVVYTTGASAPSNDCKLTTSALDSIFSGIAIKAVKGQIEITGAQGQALQVVAVDGKVIFSGIAAEKNTVAVAPGVYVVKAGEKVAKLLVR
ncbi:MAG: choice-of-anchor J domain-containing protein [Duncaniella sp.]|nr:choice-of-anchor J domain-containing protein [Duncaniella sp.]